MLVRSMTVVLLLCAAGACTPTANPSIPTTQVASGPGVQECRQGMADVSGQPAASMTVTPSGTPGADGVTKMVVASPNGRRALCQIGAGGKPVKFDMM